MIRVTLSFLNHKQEFLVAVAIAFIGMSRPSMADNFLKVEDRDDFNRLWSEIQDIDISDYNNKGLPTAQSSSQFWENEKAKIYLAILKVQNSTSAKEYRIRKDELITKLHNSGEYFFTKGSQVFLDYTLESKFARAEESVRGRMTSERKKIEDAAIEKEIKSQGLKVLLGIRYHPEYCNYPDALTAAYKSGVRDNVPLIEEYAQRNSNHP